MGTLLSSGCFLKILDRIFFNLGDMTLQIMVSEEFGMLTVGFLKSCGFKIDFKAGQDTTHLPN